MGYLVIYPGRAEEGCLGDPQVFGLFPSLTLANKFIKKFEKEIGPGLRVYEHCVGTTVIHWSGESDHNEYEESFEPCNFKMERDVSKYIKSLTADYRQTDIDPEGNDYYEREATIWGGK